MDHQEHNEHTHPGVYEIDCFDRGASKVDFSKSYDLTTLKVGAGTNVTTTTPSENTLTTGGNIGNSEGTRIIIPIVTRDREYFAEIRVHLEQITNTEFRFGFYKDADEYVYIEFDASVDANWRLTIDDGTGAEFAAEVYGVVALETNYYLRLWVDPDGKPHWAISTDPKNIEELGITGIDNRMTADGHYCEYYIRTEANLAKIAEIDYLETIKNK